ncbi:MAG: hypothetical protein IJO56_06350 [Oscillospiraceae bacterium]|nr:hypothetical protein [Oscillospiraceae bacterium]
MRKLDEAITFRLTPELKLQLIAIAEQKEWTLSHLVNWIVKQYLEVQS